MGFNRGNQDLRFSGPVANIYVQIAHPNEGAGTSVTSPPPQVGTEQSAPQRGHDETKVMDKDENQDHRADALCQVNSQMEEFSTSLATLEEQVQSCKDHNRELEDRTSELEDQNKELKDKNSKLEEQNKGLEEQNKGLEDRTTKLEIQNRLLEDQSKRLDVLTKKLEDQNKRLEEQNERLESDVRELKSRNPDPAEREEVIAKLVECAFKQEEPTVEEAVDLLPSARRLGMKSLVKKLVAALTNALAVANCIIIFQLASVCQLDELVDASVDTICKNFIQVSKTCTEFCKLSVEEVSRFVFSDSVRATEEHVFEAIVLWVSADMSKRRSLLSELLPAVRVTRCSFRFLKQMLDHFLVQDQRLFRKSALERIRWMTSAGLSEVYLATRDLNRTDDREILFVMGGFCSEDTVETLDPAVGCWVSHEIEDAPSNWTWIGSVGHKVLVLEMGNERFRSLDVTTREWTQLQYLPQHRGLHGGLYRGPGLRPGRLEAPRKPLRQLRRRN